MILDVISGVSVALERGCVSRSCTRWEWKDRKYDWPRILHSEPRGHPVDPSRARQVRPCTCMAALGPLASRPTHRVTYPTIQHGSLSQTALPTTPLQQAVGAS